MNLEEREILISIAKSVAAERRFFGFKVSDWFIVATVILTLTAFYYRTSDAIERLTVVSENSKVFFANSDAYHSAILGTPFEQGRPLNSNFDVQRSREVLKVGTTDGR